MPNSDEDSRPLCKYGRDCYQKNAEHHRRFKHPQKEIMEKEVGNVKKKQKFEESDGKIEIYERESGEETNVVTIDSDSNLIDISQFSHDIKLKIETVFLVKMPKDFFCFFDFCEYLNKSQPKNALDVVDLYLVGPFDLISRDVLNVDKTAALRHYRYYYDPPEFQTVLKSNNKKLLHYGYFRDDPHEEPVFVASNEAQVGCTLNIVSENLFSAVNFHIEKVKKTADPFKKMKIQKVQNALVEWSKKNGFNLDSLTKKMRERRSKVVAKTFHSIGIVVPYNKKTELGYRQLKETDADLKKILTDLVEAETDEDRKHFWGKLQPVITCASIANDECDFGTGLELGLDLFGFGHELLHKAVLQVLTTSYNLLNRNEFATILDAHLKCRKKGEDVGTLLL